MQCCVSRLACGFNVVYTQLLFAMMQVGESVIKDAFSSFVASPLQNKVQDEVSRA